MAWKNIFIPNITTEISSENLESNDFVNLGNSYDIVSLNNLVTIGSESVIYSKSDFKISIYTTTIPGATYEPYHPTYKVYYNNTLLASTEGFDCDIVGLALGFDYSSKRAKLRTVQRRYSTYPPTPSSTRFSIQATSWSDSVQQSIYNALVNVGLIVLSGGAGSGYIGNAMLLNKKMVGYNIPTSSEASTYTESVNEAFENPVANKPKIGNGFARIRFVKEAEIVRKSLIINNTYNPEITPNGIDIVNNREIYNSYHTNTALADFNSRFTQYFLSNKTLVMQMENSQAYTLTNDGIFRRNTVQTGYNEINEWIPIKRINNPKTLYFKHKDNRKDGIYFFGEMRCVYVQNGVAYASNYIRVDSSSNWEQKALDISNLPYVDYIWILWEDADEDFKDFEIEYYEEE